MLQNHSILTPQTICVCTAKQLREVNKGFCNNQPPPPFFFFFLFNEPFSPCCN